LKRKYFTEFALNIYSSGPLIFRPSDIDKTECLTDEQKEYIKNCNLYVITKRPRLTINPGSVRVQGRDVHGELVIHLENGPQIEPFVANGYMPFDNCTAKESKYPHHTLEAFDQHGEFFRSIPISIIAGLLTSNIQEHIDLEVIYVGQAYGAAGTRNAIDRLSSHSTLQKILANLATDQPNYEIMLLLYPFEFHRLILNMDGRTIPQIDGPEDQAHAQHVFNARFKRNMRISVAEAALIKYFQPKFNEIYKSNFPSNNQKILEKVYDLDVAALGVEINSEDIGVNMFSTNRPRSEHHICKFDLHSKEQRRSFFLS